MGPREAPNGSGRGREERKVPGWQNPRGSRPGQDLTLKEETGPVPGPFQSLPGPFRASRSSGPVPSIPDPLPGPFRDLSGLPGLLGPFRGLPELWARSGPPGAVPGPPGAVPGPPGAVPGPPGPVPGPPGAVPGRPADRYYYSRAAPVSCSPGTSRRGEPPPAAAVVPGAAPGSPGPFHFGPFPSQGYSGPCGMVHVLYFTEMVNVVVRISSPQSPFST